MSETRANLLEEFNTNNARQITATNVQDLIHAVIMPEDLAAGSGISIIQTGGTITISASGSGGSLPTLATVATTGSYTDLINTPTLATVATSGSYNDLVNAPVITPPVRQYCVFDGLTYFTVIDGSMINMNPWPTTGAFTLLFWIITNESFLNNNCVISWGTTNGTCFAIIGENTFQACNGDNGINNITAVNDGNLHKCAITYDGNGNLAFFVDGIANGGGGIGTNGFTGLDIALNGTVSIGASVAGGMSGLPYFQGMLGNIGVWNEILNGVALTASNNPQTFVDGNCVAFYPLEDNLNDSSMNNNALSATDDPVFSIPPTATDESGDSVTLCNGVSALAANSANWTTPAVYATGLGAACNLVWTTYAIQASGNVNFSNLPTSTYGLNTGDLWNNNGVLSIV